MTFFRLILIMAFSLVCQKLNTRMTGFDYNPWQPLQSSCKTRKCLMLLSAIKNSIGTIDHFLLILLNGYFGLYVTFGTTVRRMTKLRQSGYNCVNGCSLRKTHDNAQCKLVSSGYRRRHFSIRREKSP